MATSLLFSAKEALFKAICPFVDDYFGFEAAELTGCSGLDLRTTASCRSGWLQLQLVTDWVIAKAPQKNYRCWFSCSASDVLTLVCSDDLDKLWLRS
jgi:4'-phosphopantetheinyl transferase EntD